MPLRSQIIARLQREISPTERIIVRPGARAQVVEVTGRDPDSGLLIGTDESGAIHQLNDLSAGSSLGRVSPAIILNDGPGAIAS